MFSVIAAVIVAFFELLQLLEGSPKPPKPPSPPMAPHELYTLWTVLAAGLLAACACVPFLAATFLRKGPSALVIEFVHAPLNPPAALLLWVAAVVIGVVYLTVGLRGAAEGPHRGLWAFWSAALPIVAGVVLWLHAPRLLGNPWVRDVCLVVAVMCAMRFYLAIRGGTAERAVRRNIERKSAPLRAARRRRWVFF